MTAKVATLAGAPSTPPLTWDTIEWQKVVADVRQLQMRIAKAYRERKYGKAKSLQWLLTHSFSAKLLAIKRVTQNQGGKTPGIDNVVWKTPNQKMKAALSLRRRGYQTKPLKRIYIPKKQPGKLRPLSIPVMACRAQQALHLLALEPIAETIADKNAYGFRPLRSAADAIGQCFNSLARKTSAKYILEADIKACFDNISKEWILGNTPMDQRMLEKWLTAGYIENGKQHATERGTPQGGVISPTLLTVTLSGLEKVIKTVTRTNDKVHFISYADDFVITGATQDVLENKVKPAVEAFLNERGLSLSQDKTKISHIDEGFDFLGMNLRKYKGKLLIKPAKSSVKRFLTDIRETIKHHKTVKTETLIQLLNPKIQGWTNYYRHICAKSTFYYVDHEIFEAIWRWAIRRHKSPKKGKPWIKRKYFRRDNKRDWVFSSTVNNNNIDLIEAAKTPIVRHIKIKSEVTPFDPTYHEYFEDRISSRYKVKKSRKKPTWWLCWWNLLKPMKRRNSRIATGGHINT